MQIPGSSSEALKANYNQNRYKYNGIEYDTAFGLDLNEAHFRDLDPETGRWSQIEPKPEMGESSYASMGNNPILHNDPLGDSTKPGRSITLGGNDINTNDKGYRQILTAVEKANKKNAKNAPPLLTATDAVTKGTFGVRAKLLGVGVEFSASNNEKDVSGMRDNNQVKGTQDYRNGMDVSVVGMGGEFTIESKNPMNASGNPPDQYSTTQNASVAGISTVVQHDENGNQTYQGAQANIVTLKVGFMVGIDISINVNVPTNNYVSPPLSNIGSSTVSDMTRVKINFPAF